MACILCQTDEPTDRACGFDVCETCRLGRLEPGLTRWGLSLDTRQRREVHRHRRGTTVEHFFEAEVALSEGIDASAWFRLEGPLDKAMQLLRRSEPQAGDPLFDRLVFVDRASGDQLGPLLGREGVQSALLELVPFVPVALSGTALRFEMSWNDEFDDDYPDPMGMVVSLVLLAVHLEMARPGGAT